MAREDSDSLSASDVEALLRIVGAGRPAAGEAARLLDGLCKLLPARSVEAGEGRQSTAAAARRPRGSPGGPDSTRAVLADGGRRLRCVIGPATRLEFRRDPRDQPFGARELALVAAMAGAGRLGPDEPNPPNRLGALDGFDGSIGLAAGELAAGKPWARLAKALAGLPLRQCQVLGRLQHGASEKEVARSLRLDINTVKFHVKRLYRRFGVSSRGELIAHVFFGDRRTTPLAPITPGRAPARPRRH